jgi:hypothetical protein
MSSIASLKKQIEISARGLEMKQSHYDSLKKQLSTDNVDRKIWVIAAGVAFIGGFVYGVSPKARHFVKRHSGALLGQAMSSGVALTALRSLLPGL